MKRIKVTQIASTIKRSAKQKRTIKALGLGKINKNRIFEVSPQVLGMIKKVQHLVTTEIL